MAEIHSIKFYPVGNGDTAQIILSGGRRVLLDFCHRQKSEDKDTPEIDLKKQLTEELKTAQRDNFDVVAFTHADKDHIQGSTDFFELQHATVYQGEGRIKIAELWVPAAMLIEEAERDQQQEEFVVLRQEARYRLLEGKGILVFSKKPQAVANWLTPMLAARGEPAGARDHLFVDAGTIVPGFTLEHDGVEFFSHSPFIKHCDEGDIIRNRAALVFNIRFRADGNDYNFLAVGDAEWCDLEDIVNISKYHNNDDRLKWNLYNIPHHCSYTALSDDKGDRETIPKPLVKELLLQGQPDAYLVSSSCPIPNLPAAYSEIQPPHIQGRNCYERHLREVGGRRFVVTMEEPNEKTPEPIVFEVAYGGITLQRSTMMGAPAIVSSVPPRAG